MSKRIGVYPGSFDPFTNGHYDIVSRASRLFDKVIVAVGKSHGKKTLFTTDERVEMIGEVCKSLDNVVADTFEGLVVEYARAKSAMALIRGLRTENDFTYEMQMAMMNKGLHEELETVFIPTSQMYSHISSTLVKEVSSYGGDVNPLVPPHVFEKLSGKFN